MRYARLLVVVTPAADRSLVALDVAKDELGVPDATTDMRIVRWIAETSATINRAVGRVLRAETVMETFRASAWRHDAPGEHFYPRDHGLHGDDPPDGGGLSLTRYPLVSVDRVTEDGADLTVDVDFEADPAAGLLYRLSGSVRVPWYGQFIQVGYRGGYPAADDVEPDLQAACLTLLKHRKAGQARDPMLRQVSIPGVMEQQYWGGAPGDTAGLPPEVAATIARYRDVRL